MFGITHPNPTKQDVLAFVTWYNNCDYNRCQRGEELVGLKRSVKEFQIIGAIPCGAAAANRRAADPDRPPLCVGCRKYAYTYIDEGPSGYFGSLLCYGRTCFLRDSSKFSYGAPGPREMCVYSRTGTAIRYQYDRLNSQSIL